MTPTPPDTPPVPTVSEAMENINNAPMAPDGGSPETDFVTRLHEAASECTAALDYSDKGWVAKLFLEAAARLQTAETRLEAAEKDRDELKTHYAERLVKAILRGDKAEAELEVTRSRLERLAKGRIESEKDVFTIYAGETGDAVDSFAALVQFDSAEDRDAFRAALQDKGNEPTQPVEGELSLHDRYQGPNRTNAACGRMLDLRPPSGPRTVYFCELEARHDGPHRADDGAYWSFGGTS